jgi:hypothetical protein
VFLTFFAKTFMIIVCEWVLKIVFVFLASVSNDVGVETT